MPLFLQTSVCRHSLLALALIESKYRSRIGPRPRLSTIKPILGNLTSAKPIIQFCLYFICKFVLVLYMFKSGKYEESAICFCVFVEPLLCDRHVLGTEDVAVNRTGKSTLLMGVYHPEQKTDLKNKQKKTPNQTITKDSSTNK